MNLHAINSINQYNNFLKRLNPFGKFQKKLTLLTTLFWLFSGIVKTILDKQIFCNVNQELPFLTLSVIIGLFISTYLSNYHSRRHIIIGLSAVFMIGALLLYCPNDIFMQIAIYMVSFSQYSIGIIASCIIFEYVQTKLIPILAWTFIFSYHSSKLISIFIFAQVNQHESKQYILSSVILAFGILQLAGSFVFKESLRYLIDNDIAEAELLALQISEQNSCTDERILNFIQGSFIWNKVNIKKYGLSSFKKYKSLGRETYYLGISFLCLGIFGKFALAIFQINERKKNVQFEHEVQLLWVYVFQFLGFLPGIISYQIFKRRKICLITAIIATFFSLALLILVKYIIIPHSLIAVFALLGINSFLQSVLFFFMFLQSIQFYPHTMRTIGVGLCIGFYFLGQLLFNLHFYYLNDERSSFQLVFCCSFIMVFHLYNITQTFDKGLNYEIKQIEQHQFIED